MTLPGFVEVRTCPFCGTDNLHHHKTVTSAPMHEIQFCGGPLSVRTLASYYECHTCGLILQTPRMTDERIAQYYASGLYRATLGIPQEVLDYSEKQRGEHLAEWLLVQHIRPASHLDIGCSRTYFLDMVDAPDKLGFDENTVYAGDGVYVEGDRTRLGKYELVTAIHVLEHTTDPQAQLAWYASLSIRHVLVEVPQVGAPLRFPHLFYFKPAILVKMMQDTGLNIIKVETESDTRILASVL